MTPPTTTESAEKAQKAQKIQKMSPIEIRTTQSLGLQVPLGLVMTKLRTDATQAIAIDESAGVVVLTNQDAVSGPPASDSSENSILDTTIAGVSIFA